MIILGPVAVAKNGIIGGDNDLPWYFPEDLKHFKEITMGKTVLMGRKTYESILKRLGKPLPGRKNIVITTNATYEVPEGVAVYPDIETAVSKNQNDDLYFIGGASIFKKGLELAQYMYLTHVHDEYPGDVYFPEVDWNLWEKVREAPHEHYTYAEYQKRHGENQAETR
nr:Dihydrofolate reductase [uncultured bacterium]